MPNKSAVPCLTLYGSAALSLLLSGGVRAAEPDDFRVLTAADLVSLCGRSERPELRASDPFLPWVRHHDSLARSALCVSTLAASLA
jgi:hypothetical protein